MQTLRKKNSPLKYKNETTRFLGEGVSFKAKLIGILEVSEARGDRMCQEALSDLKVAIRAAGEHKQRITINIAIDGLRLRDEKNGDSLYHHPVHKISFIAQDMTDSRAFGYIFGSPDTGHRFFGIKTDKAASQVVIAMRDLFQVVFALKKKEIELAKQHLDKSHYTCSQFQENSISPSKLACGQDTKKGSDGKRVTNLETKTYTSSPSTAVADLVDLELELNSLQQGLTQMERITPSDPFGSGDDPFGDSFTNYKKNRILLPPPPGKDKTSRVVTQIETNASDSFVSKEKSTSDNSQEFDNKESDTAEWSKTPLNSNVFEEPLVIASKPAAVQHELLKQEILSQFDVFMELDPLGTGKVKPYVDKKHFFQELKNPPKTVLNDLVISSKSKEGNLIKASASNTSDKLEFNSDPFGEDPFREQQFENADFSKHDPFNTEETGRDSENTLNSDIGIKRTMGSPLNTFLLSRILTTNKYPEIQSSIVSNSAHDQQVTFAADFSDKFGDKPFDAKRSEENISFSDTSESVPEPPPRGLIDPPPLPPKRQGHSFSKPPAPPPQDNIPLSNEKINCPEQQPQFTFVTTVLNPDIKEATDQNSSAINKNNYHSYQASIPIVSSTANSEFSDKCLESLSETFKQLTMSSLNDLAIKLNIPEGQLSNMTLAQLTEYLENSKFRSNTKYTENLKFTVDFSQKFDDTNNSVPETYDRYAVFRNLLEEEANKTKDTDVTEDVTVFSEEQLNENMHNLDQSTVNKTLGKDDKYAALRDIAVKSDVTEYVNDSLNKHETGDDRDVQVPMNKLIPEEYDDSLNGKDEKKLESPMQINDGGFKRPATSMGHEVLQKNRSLTSGSLSDVASGSSPEVDKFVDLPEQEKENVEYTGMSWAIFDSPKDLGEERKEMQAVQSEEGASPWSSDSKEFGVGTPPEWKQSIDSSNGEDHLMRKRRRRKQNEWWCSFGEPTAQCYSSMRPSAKDAARYEYHNEIHHRCHSNCPQSPTHIDHSSSSRDVSPEESRDEDIRTTRNRESKQSWFRHGGKYSLERRRCRKYTDSWDEEDDYEYEKEHSNMYGWLGHNHYARDIEVSDNDEGGKWTKALSKDRKFRWWEFDEDGQKCCVDWRMEFEGKHGDHYCSGRILNSDINRRRYEKKHDHCNIQEMNWDECYHNGSSDGYPSVYSTHKRNWKRPSSTSELEQKMNQWPRAHCGGSDGERDRRFKSSRRSKSRDSQYSDFMHGKYTQPINSVAKFTAIKRQPHMATHFDTHMKQEMHQKEKLEHSCSAMNKKELASSYRRKDMNQELTVNSQFVSIKKNRKFQHDIIKDEPLSKEPKNNEIAFVNEEPSVFGNNAALTKPAINYFEDDFTSDKSSKIEPIVSEQANDEFPADMSNVENIMNSGKKNRHRNKTVNNFKLDVNLKKSESINIFDRENDPFDDDFFNEDDTSLKTSEYAKNELSMESVNEKWSKFADFT